MKRKHADFAGNALMIVGLLGMVGGVGYAVLNELPQLHLSEFMVHCAIFSIFIGALVWLVGARVSGREKINDRYYWVRHYGDKRCRRHNGQHSHQ